MHRSLFLLLGTVLWLPWTLSLAIAADGGAAARVTGTCVEISPRPHARFQATLAPANLPTFIYTNWPSQADVDSLELYVSLLLPVAEEIMGPPMTDGPVEVVHDPNLPYPAMYTLANNKLFLRNRPTVFFGRLHILAHEFGHVWRDDWELYTSVLAEGLAETGESSLMARMPVYYRNRYDIDGQSHSSAFAVTEQIANRPEIGSPGGMFGTNLVLIAMRYNLSNLMLWRIQESSGGNFLRQFHEELRERVEDDPLFHMNPEGVLALIEEIAPIVDGVPFATYWQSHCVANMNPPLGDQIVVYGHVIGCFSIERQSDGDEIGYAGLNVEWSAHDRFGNLLAAGTAVTNTQGGVSPQITTAYRGRADVWFRSHLPSGTQETTASYWITDNTSHPYAGLGLFGFVDEAEGEVVVIALDGGEEFVTTIDQGQFSIPELESIAGAFRIVWNGRERIIRKDAVPYLVLLNEETTVPVAVAETPAHLAPTLTVTSAPNPFTEWTRIAFSMPTQGAFDLGVYDVSGRLLKKLIGDTDPIGSNTVTWDGRLHDGSRAARGIYYVQLRAGGREVSHALCLID